MGFQQKEIRVTWLERDEPVKVLMKSVKSPRSILFPISEVISSRIKFDQGARGAEGTLEERFIRVKFSTRISVTKHVLRHREHSIPFNAFSNETHLPNNGTCRTYYEGDSRRLQKSIKNGPFKPLFGDPLKNSDHILCSH